MMQDSGPQPLSNRMLWFVALWLGGHGCAGLVPAAPLDSAEIGGPRQARLGIVSHRSQFVGYVIKIVQPDGYVGQMLVVLPDALQQAHLVKQVEQHRATNRVCAEN
jgi:hypothetical protein